MASEPDASPDASHAEGIVVRSTGSWYDVDVGGRVVPSKMRGRFRLADSSQTNPVAVGDRVTIRVGDDDTGLITVIHDRRNALMRRAAGRRVGREQVIVANVDAAWLVQSIRMPKINPGLVDRFLVMAESFEIPPAIVFNKRDLMKPADEDAVFFLRDLYEEIGYDVLMTSAETGEGVEDFRARLRDCTSVVAGPSGVGKSSLLNAAEPGLDLRTAEVSLKTRKGRHTTTNAALFPLADGGFVVDTPGIREFGIVDLEPEELDYYFVEFRPYLGECRFPNCTHDHEPGCAVIEAMEAEEITDLRYYSYLNILESIRPGAQDVGR